MRLRVPAWACLLVLAACDERPPREEPVGAPFGAACGQNTDCESSLCVVNAEPFCTRECPDDCSCPAGMACLEVGGGLSVCAPGDNPCVGSEDAGAPLTDAGAPPTDAGGPQPDAGHGGGAGAPCTSSADCADVTSRGGTGGVPEVMTVPQECWTEDDTGLPGGLCSMADCETNFMRDPCPTDTGCIMTNRGGVCLPACDGPADCRHGWTCRGDIDAEGPNHIAVCWFSCARTGCAEGLTCAADGTCEVAPTGPLDGCTAWDSGWSCVDRSPSLCSCSCYDWPHAGTAPLVECELTAANEVTCTCRTGGGAGERVSASVDLAAAGADCGQAETVFGDSFCGLVP